MRSRFTAFKLRNFDYLIQTVKVKENEPPLTEQSFDSQISWLGLKVIASKKGTQKDQKGVVEFVAFYQETQSIGKQDFLQLHEISNFEVINSRWMYVDGNPLKDIKLARNDECFCGSGKKFKKCHGG